MAILRSSFRSVSIIGYLIVEWLRIERYTHKNPDLGRPRFTWYVGLRLVFYQIISTLGRDRFGFSDICRKKAAYWGTSAHPNMRGLITEISKEREFGNFASYPCLHADIDNFLYMRLDSFFDLFKVHTADLERHHPVGAVFADKDPEGNKVAFLSSNFGR